MKSKNTIHITRIIIIDIAPVYFHKVYLGLRECDNCNFIFAKYFTFIMLSLHCTGWYAENFLIKPRFPQLIHLQ